MRALPILAVLFVALTLSPVASAHTDTPNAPNWLFQQIPCDEPLPLYDYSLCLAGWAQDGADAMVPYAEAMALVAAHVLGCHVVGGPACVV